MPVGKAVRENDGLAGRGDCRNCSFRVGRVVSRPVGWGDCGEGSGPGGRRGSGPVGRGGRRSCGRSEGGRSGSWKVGRVSRGDSRRPEGRSGGREIGRVDTW